MNALLYVDYENKYLVKRYLQEYGNKYNIYIICMENMNDFSLEQKKNFNIKDIIIYPENFKENLAEIKRSDELIKIEKVISELKINKVTLPFSVLNGKLFFVKSTTSPDIKPSYPIVRRLWLLGIRLFEFYNLNGSRQYEIPLLLDKFKNKYDGQRCFVVGNGPSLNDIDMTLLKDEITFGSNRCYLGYDKWDLQFTYWGVEDRLQVEEHQDDYEANVPANTIKFYPFEYVPFYRFKENFCPYNHIYGTPDFPQFSGSVDKTYLGGSITFVLLQIAVMMGFKQIILIGVDHRYDLKVSSRYLKSIYDYPKSIQKIITFIQRNIFFIAINKFIKIVIFRNNKKKKIQLWAPENAKKPTHFTDKYTKGKKFVMPRPKRAEVAFNYANKFAKEHGVEILNATPETALKSFPLVDYNGLFEKE